MGEIHKTPFEEQLELVLHALGATIEGPHYRQDIYRQNFLYDVGSPDATMTDSFRALGAAEKNFDERDRRKEKQVPPEYDDSFDSSPVRGFIGRLGDTFVVYFLEIEGAPAELNKASPQELEQHIAQALKQGTVYECAEVYAPRVPGENSALDLLLNPQRESLLTPVFGISARPNYWFTKNNNEEQSYDAKKMTLLIANALRKEER